MRTWKLVSVFVVAAACGDDGGNNPGADGGNPPVFDAPQVAPVITSFVATPSQLTAGVAADVTWTWTYRDIPTLPDPTCSINNGVGTVTNGQTTSLTLTSVTTFLLTCTNSVASGSRQVVIGLPPSAPVLATFTATPGTLTPNAATTVTFAWTFTGVPVPAPTCTIDGLGTVTSGATQSVTLPQGRIYRLRCTNSQGTATRDVAVGVDECTANTDDCGPNATCTDTAESYTCSCASGFTGNGDTCSSLQSCFVTPSLCDTNATCTTTTAGPACVCNPGFVGSGTPGGCDKARIAFVTSTTGTGNLSTWAGATGVGLAAADSVCQARANAAPSLQGLTFVAWMSDSTSDAYCRVHGLTGKKATNCGQTTLPTSAGPWMRPGITATSTPPQAFAPTIDRLLAPNHVVYQPASVTELGTEVGSTDRVFTATDSAGVFIAPGCNDWTSTAVTGSFGEAHGGGTTWTDSGATDLACSTSARLRCVQVASGSGPALPSRHAPPSGFTTAKRIFVTSVSGTGNLGTWSDATGATGLAAGDAICQARARFGGYTNAASFKAWLSSSTSAASRVLTNGPWVRPDGAVVATSESDLEDGLLKASIHQTETSAYLPGNAETGSVWTGTTQSGSASFTNCATWSSTSSSGTTGRHDFLDLRWTTAVSNSCTADQRLICLED